MTENKEVCKINRTVAELKLMEKQFYFMYKNKDKINKAYYDAFLDNYEPINNKLKSLKCVDKNIKVHYSGNYLEIGRNLMLLSEGANLPDTKIICNFINELQKEIKISNQELEHIKWEYSAEIIREIYRITVMDTPSQFELINLIALLSKSDNIKLGEILSECSSIEKIFNQDVTGIYGKSDDITKSKIRFMTSVVAKKYKKTEQETAEDFVNKANSAYDKNLYPKEQQIAYYAEKEYNKIYSRISAKTYITLNILLSTLLSLYLAVLLNNLWFTFILLLPIWEITKIIIDLIISKNNGSAYLDRLQNYNKIPDNAKTLAVISVVVPNADNIKVISKKMEKLYHLNKSNNLKYCILCDFVPASIPSNTKNKPILDAARSMVRSLNSKYNDSFVLALREQTFSKTEGKYIGKDRKRGAIEDLVKIIKGEKIISVKLYGDTKFVRKVKYLIALDFDTVPLMDSFTSLISIAEHPINKPYISNGKVVSGYGIITPRITTKLSSSMKTPFSKLFGGIGSSCAYDVQSSNLYQDTFDSGIFSGKGLINVDAFYKVCCDFFNKDEVLSHDILEGGLLRTGFAGDIEFRDDFPSKTMSYFKRQNRWIRGDIQNINFICGKINTQQGLIENPLGNIVKFQLFDNIRRAFTPIAQFFIPVYAAFSPMFHQYNINVIILICILSILFPFIVSEIELLFTNRFFSLSRKYYSSVLSDTKSVIFKALYTFILLPQNAVVSADAIIRAFFRKFISHKHLLQWSTAAQTDNKIYNSLHVFTYYLPAEIFSISLLLSIHPILRILGLIWSIFPFAIFFGNKKYTTYTQKITTEKEILFKNDVAEMWGYYNDYCTGEYNYLPPDNVQFSPVFRVCERTSPTNIGMMMLSLLTVRDFGIIDTDALVKKAERTVASIEKMEKFHGNLYNWYNIKTLTLSPNPFVSSVDSGNFICAMTALAQGLKEYRYESQNIAPLIERIDKIINDTDLGIFYNRSINLFSVGINPSDGALSEHHYDMLMSEARMMSYYAIAKRIVPKKHWRSLSRSMKRLFNYTGTVSYGGTMFEYFMPELLLKSEYGSLCYESLKYCVHAQKHEGKKNKLPYGVSESAYFAFDENLNYLYKPSGVQNAGMKRGLNSDFIVSPYSSYLASQIDLNSAYYNLGNLEKYGTKGIYGHYEAIDFTHNKKTGAVVKSYMAHHVGMSIAAIANVINKGIMQKRFMRDPDMASARELLEEKIISGSNVLENNDKDKNSTREKPAEAPMENLFFNRFYPQQPKVKVLSNGEYTMCVSDIGAIISLYQSNDIFARTSDTLNSPKGNFFAVEDNNNITHFSYLPSYNNDTNLTCEFLRNNAVFANKTDELNIKMSVSVHNYLPAEYREITLKNLTSQQKSVNLLGYFEPVLMNHKSYDSHPAFARLFLEVEYDKQDKMIYIKRKDRNGEHNLYTAIGFFEDRDYNYNFSKEDVLERFEGEKTLFKNHKEIKKNGNYIPNPCVYLSSEISLKPHEQKTVALFITTSFSKDDLMRNITKIKFENSMNNEKGYNPVSHASIEERVAENILPQILFNSSDGRMRDEMIAKNTLSIAKLWEISISGDIPLVSMEFTSKSDEETLRAYASCQNALKICGIAFDFAVLYKGSNNASLLPIITNAINRNGLSENLGINGGIHIINISKYDESFKTLILAASTHIVPNNIVQIGIPSSLYEPLKINPVNPPESVNSGFTEDGFIIAENTPVPWSHILSSPQFGTLVSNASLGFTYAINSFENSLTKWNNDVITDNRSELLLLKYNDVYFDLLLGSAAKFTEHSAIYKGITEFFESTVTVTISKKGMCKRISLELLWKTTESDLEIYYYTEPVLSSSKDKTSMIKTEFTENCLLLSNPQNTAVKGYMSITSDEAVSFMTNRESFFEGKNDEVNLQSQLCGTVFTKKHLKVNEKMSVQFYLSFGQSKESALLMHKHFHEDNQYQHTIQINTPDINLNKIFPWCVNQAMYARLYARTGFYQRSGAFGFRDQLQDACAVILKNPKASKVQILRACTAQFRDGDVMHWWHSLPGNKMKGVRTLCSDDLLWLPFTVCEYIEKTSDNSLLTIKTSYCEGIHLDDGQEEVYGEVHKTDFKESVYSHCKRAINMAYTHGAHGLLKIGGGDWNDGFNKIGVDGKGESVWLTQFYIIVLRKFASAAKTVGDNYFIEEINGIISELYKSLDETFDDGQYARAYLADETTLGTQDSEFCKIDLLPQSFSVLSEMPDKEKNMMAMDEAYNLLVDHEYKIIKLFTPPFPLINNEIGYITAYPQGIRENGGQYTHASIWFAIAMLESGEIERGYELIKMLNPAERYQDKELFSLYKNEPYYLSADIYTNEQCTGRGGWSIYTGAAGWYYRAVLEWLLGISISKKGITVKPNIPKEWNGFSVKMDIFETEININVIRGEKENSGLFDNGSRAFYIPADKEKHDAIVIIE